MENDLLADFLNLEIPSVEIPSDGFLEIIGLSHYENINSKIYSYFLDQEKNENISSLFMYSLSEIILEKTGKNIIIDTFEVFTEVSTAEGRIDIVIEDSKNKSVIIIENKIYHNLNNPLLDYWKHYKYKNKLGIILTLFSQSIPVEVNKKFINITHIEWINKIKKNGFPANIELKLYAYLNDFIQTMENLTNTKNMNEQTKFYFQHAKKIKKAVNTFKGAVKFISNQLDIVASELNLSTYGKNDSWRNIWDKEKNRQTYYTIVFNELLNGNKKIQIIIELQKNDRNNIPLIKERLDKDSDYQKLYKNGYARGNYVHFLSKSYTLKEEEIQNLSDFIVDKIISDFDSVMSKILNIIDAENLKSNIN